MHIKHFREYDCVFDNNNNLIEVYENQILTCRYKYNKHSKVIREDNVLLNESIEYKYNKFDKLVKRNVYDYTLHTLKNVKSTDNFTYDTNNPTLLISYNNENFKYDLNGVPCLFRDAKLKISNNKLLNLDNNTFTYDENNCRTTKIVGKTTTKFYRENNKLIKQESNITLTFIYKNNKIQGFIYNNKKYFYKKNYNNDIVGIYNENHILICRYVYDCLGNHKFILSNQIYYTLADANPFRFHSYYFDIETGLYYINGKYYDAEIGVFMN